MTIQVYMSYNNLVDIFLVYVYCVSSSAFFYSMHSEKLH